MAVQSNIYVDEKLLLNCNYKHSPYHSLFPTSDDPDLDLGGRFWCPNNSTDYSSWE